MCNHRFVISRCVGGSFPFITRSFLNFQMRYADSRVRIWRSRVFAFGETSVNGCLRCYSALPDPHWVSLECYMRRVVQLLDVGLHYFSVARFLTPSPRFVLVRGRLRLSKSLDSELSPQCIQLVKSNTHDVSVRAQKTV